MRLPSTGALIVVAAGLVGCVTVPVGPAVPVLPGANKGPGEFGADDANCRNYAQAATAGAAQAATDNAAASAAAGTVLGGVTGALIGAAVGDAGAGAAIGAGTGLLWGGAASAPGYASYDLQRRYDAYYVQCMVARGNLPPWRATYRAPTYPPPNTPPPQGLGPGAAVTPPPSAALPGNYPPPGTPAPVGIDGGARGRIVPAPVNPPPRVPPPGAPSPGTPAPTF